MSKHGECPCPGCPWVMLDWSGNKVIVIIFSSFTSSLSLVVCRIVRLAHKLHTHTHRVNESEKGGLGNLSNTILVNVSLY